MKEKDRILFDEANRSLEALSSATNGSGFIEPCSVESFKNSTKQTVESAKKRSKGIFFRLGLVNKPFKSSIIEFLKRYEAFPEDAHKHNVELAERLSVDVGRMINPVEGRDLDRQQLSSIAMNVNTRLVIAGAGTGKTTTIIGLVKELLMTEKAQPEEILLLSFTNASVNELKERILKETSKRIDTTTFHRLGLKIIASTRGKTPNVSHTDLNQFVTDELQRRVSDPQFLADFNSYIAFDYNSQTDEFAFATNEDYVRYVKENPLITLNGEKVKSFGEADIANFLAINGVPYTYEDAYPVDTSDAKHGHYHPDFHINGTNIYIEYFGTDRYGNVAQFMLDANPNAAEDYRQSMEWKRTIHRINNTELVELFAYNRSEGTLLEDLKNHLTRLGVEMSPASPSDLFDRMFNSGRLKFSMIASSMTTAILLIKGYGKPWDEVYPTSKDRRVKQSLIRLEKVLRPIYEEYQDQLAINDEIDFEDMLNMASECVKEGYIHPYRYVIVDEYQDISRSRFNLLKEMRASKDYRLFCVGDDWQSIYRFNGSDVSYILDFEDYWGPSEICKIETTYRFSGELLQKSSEFIMRNPRQFKKDLVGRADVDCRIIRLSAKTEADAYQRVAEELALIPANETILFLGRYRHDIVKLEDIGLEWKPNLDDGSFKVTDPRRPELKMTFMTIHGSKGLQASRVFILNNKTGSYGFPNVRDEPPIIPLLMNSQDNQLDEERRLFYVAMTRAKKRVYLVAVNNKESRFYKEIANSSGGQRRSNRPITCPICGGDMVLRKGKYGLFYGCSNFPKTGCKYTVKYESGTNQNSVRKR